jgi:hypothetical protein
MKLVKVFQICFSITLACSSVLLAQEQDKQAALAVIVDNAGGGEELGKNLQPLIEAEAALQWDGKIVERKEIDKLLDEMKISRSGLIDPNTQLQFGKMIHMDCLLTVRINKESAKTTMSLFPSTTIIHEKEYRERLEPQSLAINIVTNAIKAYREHTRDPNKPQVSIGSFFYADPHRRFLDFSTKLELQLRDELIKNKSIVLTERLFPSDLLREFKLTRAGIIENISRNLSAPPSDILLYCEFKPNSEQDLTKPDAELNFTLFIISPTGLCKSGQIEFSCYSNKLKDVIKQATKFIEQSKDEVRANLTKGQRRAFSNKEFDEFKKQAFRLMPYPPMLDGDYYKQAHYLGPSQTGGKPAEFERALHMLECAMLFKGDDTQALVCAGAVLNAMSERFITQYTESTKKVFLNSSLELIERAYFIESNWNTRGMFVQFCLFDSWAPGERPSMALKAAQQIWRTRDTEPWQPHQLQSAFFTLFAKADFKSQIQLFLDVAPEYEKKEGGLSELSVLFQNFINKISDTGNNSKEILLMQDFAEKLMLNKSLILQFYGHKLFMTICLRKEESVKDANLAKEFSKHLKIAIEMIPELNKAYGKQFFNTLGQLRGFLQKYQTIIKKYNLEYDASDLQEIYLEEQLEVKNYDSPENAILFRNLLPSMWERGKYKKAYDLITEFLEHYSAGGSGDYDRMWLARQRTRFSFALEGKNSSFTKQFEKIAFDDGNSDSVIKIVVNQGKNIYGIRGNPNNTYSNKKAFILPSSENQAHILKQLAGDISDIACTDSFIGIGTKTDGLYLLDSSNSEIHHLVSENSGLPSPKVTLICNSGRDFCIGIPDKENLYTHIYRINPIEKNIIYTNTKFVVHSYWQLKPNTMETDKSPVIPQTWNRRTVVISGQNLEFLCKETISPIKDVTISSNKGGDLLHYKGLELSYVYDFILWCQKLIFATGNGLYISKPGSNEIHCIISEPDLLFFSLCQCDDKLYIGTSEGLYCISADKFNELVKSIQ